MAPGVILFYAMKGKTFNKYKIKVIEILEREVEVTAYSRENAIAKVQEQYDSEEIVLDYTDYKETKIQ